MSSMGVCTTRHWQKSGQLMQELNGCIVGHVRDSLKFAVAKRAKFSLRQISVVEYDIRKYRFLK